MSVDGISQDPIYTQFFMVPETLSSSFTGAKQSTRAAVSYTHLTLPTILLV